jgi:hypothetical protein
MFGYVRPLKCELKVREFEQFRSCYCSLCHELSRRYGLPARFILNYDFVFLSMLLWPSDQEPGSVCRRCAVHPLHRTCTWRSCAGLSYSAGCSVILTWWKLQDSCTDGKFGTRAKASIAKILLHRAYQKARGDYPAFDKQVAVHLKELTQLEVCGERSLDRMADKFASLLSSATEPLHGDSATRACKQLLYHLGRWIYITDAVDDLKDDLRTGAYNPLKAHFHIESGDLTPEQKELVCATLVQSSNMCISAYELMPMTRWSPIIRNILYLGLPFVCRRVLDGTFRGQRTGFPDQNGEV